MGMGDRPLLSKDGSRATVFVDGTIVVRDVDDCRNMIDTGIRGAKADFSWDGRYIAFHVLKADGRGYEIQVVDTEERTVRTITHLVGSSFFPSWTKDGRLCFRYDGENYNGFVIADNVFSAPAHALPRSALRLPAERRWNDLFPETPVPREHWALVLVWGTWGAHSADALIDLQRAGEAFAREGRDVGIAMGTDPGSHSDDVASTVARYHVAVRRIPIEPERLWLTEETNQNPTTLLFREGILIGRRMGAQSSGELEEWIRDAGSR